MIASLESLLVSSICADIECLFSLFYSFQLRQIDSIMATDSKISQQFKILQKKRRTRLYQEHKDLYGLNLVDLILGEKILKMVFWTVRSGAKTFDCRKKHFTTYLTKSVSTSHLTLSLQI